MDPDQLPARSLGPWERPRRRAWRRSVLAAAVGLALVGAITLGIPERVSQPVIPAALVLFSVFIASVLGGAAAGTTTLVAGLASFAYFFLAPHEQLTGRSATQWAGVAAIGLVGVALVVSITVLRWLATRARQERARLDVLLRVSSRFDLNLDPEDALREIGGAIVPEFADHCIIDLLTEDGTLRRIAAADLDPGTNQFASQLERYPPPPEQVDHPSWRVLRTGEPFLHNSVSEATRRTVILSPEHLEIVRLLNRQSLLFAPIVSDGTAIGTLTLAQRAVSGRRFTKHDVPVARELGVRAGSAIQNAFEHDRLRAAFIDVQRALLPRQVPLIDGVRVGTRYVPAGAASEVGGDWYAIVPIGPDRMGLAVGDAVGSGPAATATMARARFALLGLARRGADPATVLTELNALLFAIEATEILTTVYGILDVAHHTWTEARAGHLPTLVRDPNRTTRALDVKPGVPLGVLGDVQYRASTHALAPGSAIVLYTDGLVERRTEMLDAGIERLQVRVRDLDPDLDVACAAITEELVGDEPEDDVALLIAQLTVHRTAPSVALNDQAPGH